MKLDLDKYYKDYKNLILSDDNINKIHESSELLKILRANGNKVIIVGNGASSSIASHGSVDLTKQAKVKSINFNEANLLTAFSNDYGFENCFSKAYDFYSEEGDIVIAVSVSGESKNVINICKKAKKDGNKLITFSGKLPTNELRSLGDINFWVDSAAYNIVECIHMIWLTSIVDNIIGKAEYDVS